MKKHINLVIKQKKYQDLEKAFKKLKMVAIILVGIFIGLSILFLGFLYVKKTELEKIQTEEQSLYDYINTNKEAEAKFSLFRGKEQQINTILKKDVNFYPYYNLLVESLSKSDNSGSNSATLDSLSINSERQAKFTVAFNTFDELISQFKYFESEAFLTNFTQLSVVNFNPVEQAKASTYRLNFEGTFKQIQ